MYGVRESKFGTINTANSENNLQNHFKSNDNSRKVQPESRAMSENSHLQLILLLLIKKSVLKGFRSVHMTKLLTFQTRNDVKF